MDGDARATLCLTALAAALLFCGVAAAGDAEDCEQVADPLLKHAGCSVVIESYGRLDRGVAWAFGNRGIAYYDLGDFRAAVADYESAIELDPSHPFAHHNRANALVQLGRLAQALAGYNRAIELDPDYLFALQGRTNTLIRLGRAQDALPDAERVIALDPNRPTGYFQRGEIRFLSGQYARAIPDFDKALALQPNHHGARARRAGASYLTGNYPRALEDVDHLAANFDPDPQVLMMRAHVLVALGRADEAMAEWERFFDLADHDMLAAFQNFLAQGGYYDGEIDGQIGPKSRAALGKCVLDGCRLGQ